MIQIKPFIDLKLICPYCNEKAVAKDFLCTGMHSMTLATCETCEKDYYQEIPINAGAFYPGILDLKTKKRVDKLPFDNWYLSGLEHSFNNRSGKDVMLEVKSRLGFKGRKVVILNTIDATYGHALYELFNASYYINRGDVDLIILIQKEFVWLLPDNIAEAWIVDIKFSEASLWFDSLAKKINEKIAAFPEVYLCQSFVQADDSDYDIADYTKLKPFPLDEWDGRLKEKPVVTFIWRNDRFWKRVLPRFIDNRFTRKLFPKPLNSLTKKFQHRWILAFASVLKDAIPQVDFAISGLDTRELKIPDWIQDFRYPEHDDNSARMQLKRYSDSHIVLGCNGSSLVLPGCMAGAVINIAPGDQWSVCLGTFPFRITSIGDTVYRYSLQTAEVSIKRLVNVTVAILRDRSYNELHSSYPWRQHNTGLDPFEWSRFRSKIFENTLQFQYRKGLITDKK